MIQGDCSRKNREVEPSSGTLVLKTALVSWMAFVVLVQTGVLALVLDCNAMPAPLKGHFRIIRLLLRLGEMVTGAAIAPNAVAAGNTLPSAPNNER